MNLTDKQKQDIEKAITNNIKGCLLKDGEMSSPKDGYKIGIYGENSAVSEIESIVSAACIQKDEEIARLRRELEKIANPLKYLKEEADKEGAQLNGQMAILMSKDAEWLKSIATEALKQ